MTDEPFSFMLPFMSQPTESENSEPKSPMESIGYIAGILPWRKIGMALCFIGLLFTGIVGLDHSGGSKFDAPEVGSGLFTIASAIAFGWGFQTLQRGEK